MLLPRWSQSGFRQNCPARCSLFSRQWSIMRACCDVRHNLFSHGGSCYANAIRARPSAPLIPVNQPIRIPFMYFCHLLWRSRPGSHQKGCKIPTRLSCWWLTDVYSHAAAAPGDEWRGETKLVRMKDEGTGWATSPASEDDEGGGVSLSRCLQGVCEETGAARCCWIGKRTSCGCKKINMT